MRRDRSCWLLSVRKLFSKVHKGEIQGQSLGIEVDVFTDEGKSALHNEKGELVVKKPFPSMPIKFWGDKNGEKYHNAYFNRFKNIWHHGDYAKITKRKGFIIFGRSDTTLNPGGVRLGTAEIYSEVEKFNEIKEALVVGQSWDNDIRIVLFLILKSNFSLTEPLLKKLNYK